jgi:hypothetical protein
MGGVLGGWPGIMLSGQLGMDGSMGGGYWEAARYRRWYREAAVMCLRPGRERLRIRCVG